MSSVDFLILGAGWTSDYLIPLLKSHQISYASTTRSGRDSTLKFEFNPDSDDTLPFAILPTAKTVLVSFPIKGLGGSKRLVHLYSLTHPNSHTGFIQLGSSGIYTELGWLDRHSPYDKSDSRAIAEDELLSLDNTHGVRTTILNLSGLWGGARDPRNWVTRVAPTKEALASKSSIHLIHGADVARSIVAVHQQFDKAAGSRWLLTDQRVYDWWDLAGAWGDGGAASEKVKGPQPQWVGELMKENGIRALPRSPGTLARAIDSREFWSIFDLQPIKARP